MILLQSSLQLKNSSSELSVFSSTKESLFKTLTLLIVGGRVSCTFYSTMRTFLFRPGVVTLSYFSGVAVTPKDMFTAQGYDLQFGTNTLGMLNFVSS